ncbi:MAG TPA: Smr/MutS family protein [Geobacteraceae bacterium]
MKKKKAPQQKPKEFAITPFTALKGVQAAVASPAMKQPPPPPVPPRPSDEADLFLLAMADVKRFHQPQRSTGTKSPATPQEQPLVRRIEEDERQVFLAALQQLQLDKTFTDEYPDDEAPLHPLPVNRMRQLRRGAIRIDYELDLHGLAREEALEALATFIGGAYQRGQQGVLVITGRGNNSPGEPVLQGAVANWLRNAGRGVVAEFAMAPRQMGGEGAFVVFLKNRDRAGQTGTQAD